MAKTGVCDEARGDEFERANLSILLDALQAAIQREDANAERLDAKTRQLLALVGVLFAVVQTIAFSSYRQGLLSGHERLWIAILALVSMLLLAFAALASFRQQAALAVSDLNLEKLGEVIGDPRRTNFLSQLCGDHLAALWSRRNANFKRRNRYQLALLVSCPAVIVIAAELFVAVSARIS
jgi:hypothetical protein